MGKEKKKKDRNNQPQIQARPGSPAPLGARCGQSRGSPAVPTGAAPGSARPAWEAAARGIRSCWGHFFVLYKPCQVCPWGKLPRAKRSRSGIRTSVPAGPRRAGAPYLVLVFLSVLRTVHGKRRFCSWRGRSEGWGALRPPELPLLPEPGEASVPRAEGLPPRALLKTGSTFELSPFFFFLPSLLPPFPSSLLPPSPFLSPFFPSPSLSHSPAFTDGTASHCVFMYIIRQLVPSTSSASLQYLYKRITLSVACTFCYGCCHSLRDLTFIF